MASLFSGGSGVNLPPPISPPTPPKETDPAIEEAARKERAAALAAIGRGDTILTNYALATQKPNALKATLGGA